MQLKPFKDLIAMSKEKIDEVMAAPRARKVKAQAEVELAELDSRIITLEQEAQELCTSKEGIDFKKLFEKLDQLALSERRKKQYGKVLKQLFPECN